MKPREQLLHSLEHQKLVFFTGAGLSFSSPANLPLGKQIIDSIIKLIIANANINNNFSPDEINQWIKRISHVPMELIWETLVEISSSSILSALKILEDGMPNDDHIAIALACEKYNISIIFTLNFDVLHEEAISKYTNLKPISVITKKDFLNFAQNSKKTDNMVYVVHLHGAIKSGNYADLITTVTKVGNGLSRYKKLSFLNFLEHNDLICAGYSNGDADTFPLILTTKNMLFWYKFSSSEDVPLRLTNPKKSLDLKLIIIERLIKENGFSELLTSIDGDIRKKMRKLKSNTLKQIVSPTPHKRLEVMEANILKYLGNNNNQRQKTSRLFLAKILDELGKRDASQKILKLASHTSSNRQSVIYMENMLAGHLNERLGNVQKAIKHFSIATQISHNKEKHYSAVLEKASAHLGIWKRSPHKVRHLLIWLYHITRLSDTENDKTEQRRLWEIGDLYHFFADYLMVPSTIVIWKFRKLLKFPVILSNVDKLALFSNKFLRIRLLKCSAHYYLSAIKLAYKLDEDTLPNYTGLALIRAAEVFAALGKNTQAQYLLRLSKEGENFYEWVQSEHGIANVTCAKAIVNFYAGNVNKSNKLLELATKQYGSHHAGVLKSKMFIFRNNYWEKK